MLLKDYGCPTVRVKVIGTDDIYVINAEDFNEEIHEELEPEPPPEEVAPVSTLLGTEINAAIEELSDVELDELTNPSRSVDLTE